MTRSNNIAHLTKVRRTILALGERSYISFAPGELGKGESELEFNDAGLLKSVSLNSDATAGAAQVNELLKTVLPFVAAP